MTKNFFEFYINLCHDINNLFKFMRKICKNSMRYVTHVFAQLDMNSNISKI